MINTNGEFYSNRESRYDDFLRTMQKDGIPARRYQEENWKRWFQNQWERILNPRKN